MVGSFFKSPHVNKTGLAHYKSASKKEKIPPITFCICLLTTDKKLSFTSYWL